MPSNKEATPPPLPASSRPAVSAAVQAKLAEATAKAEAKIAAEKAKAAVAAVNSATPHLDKFESLKGPEATAYFRENKRAIRAEQFAKSYTGAGKVSINPKIGITSISHSKS